MPSHKTIGGRFNVVTAGLVLGFCWGIYLLRDYQIIKYSPPNPDNFDENGNWKHKSFINVRYGEGVAPLELKPEALERAKKEASANQLQAAEAVKKD